MGNQILKRLLRPVSATTTGRVIGRPAAGVYLVIDQLGRQIRAESDITWQIGIDWVTVRDGRIVGRSVKGAAPQTFSV